MTVQTLSQEKTSSAEAYADGLRISYTDLGQGEPALLMLPGWCSSQVCFSRLAQTCAAQRRVLALDWRGHGQSETPSGDFGADALVADALAVIEASGVEQVIPVAQAHAGWLAFELRRRLGQRIPKMVLLEWLILEAPPPFLNALAALQQPEQWRQTREQMFSMWTAGVENEALVRFIHEVMGAHGFDMWARAAREINAAYAQAGSPLQALAKQEPFIPTLHIYCQPPAPEFLAAQQAFAEAHPWFKVQRLEAHSHFPMFEIPGEIAEAIETFVA